MSIRVALNHKTAYRYDRLVSVGPQIARLRPAPHTRTPILAYSMQVTPSDHFINWQQDPYGNFLGRVVFSKQQRELIFEVDLVAEMTVINPFEFFLETDAEHYPFPYETRLLEQLKPFLATEAAGPRLTAILSAIDRTPRRTIDFLVDLNQLIQSEIGYLIRMEPGIQTCEETLTRASGSCRDSAWLMVQILRHVGLAARFVSGYLIQLKPDVESLDGPSGAAEDFTDLHAWTEVYLPGAGWVGLDPTSGLLAGEGHIPLACSPDPVDAAPITGSVGMCEVQFAHSMSVSRLLEDPRVTKPYDDQQWQSILATGQHVDQRLKAGDVRLTMGGEPTFVSIDDMEGDEWKTAAVGPAKRKLADELLQRLRCRFGQGGLLHYGQGKWYPGEPLPRWALACLWREDGRPIWHDATLFARHDVDYGHDAEAAASFASELARQLGVHPRFVVPAYEDAWYYLWRERRLPINVDVRDAKLDDQRERDRIARIFDNGLNRPVGCVLPLKRLWWRKDAPWQSGPWPVRAEQMFLVPGDSPMGLRLPLDALPWAEDSECELPQPIDPTAQRPPLSTGNVENEPHSLQKQVAGRSLRQTRAGQVVSQPIGVGGPSFSSTATVLQAEPPLPTPRDNDDSSPHTAACVEARDGRLHVFLPPIERVEDYLDLVSAVESTAQELGTCVVVEGYLPPLDHRLRMVNVTPDPGVIEVNVQPAEDWPELTDIVTGVYAEARHSRLGTEKFDLDGRHTGTGGGNHVVLGGKTPLDSPFLRRPDLLRSLLAYWHNHPSLSYLFSGSFVGPTSQAPRVDEGRRDSMYELQIAFEQIADGGEVPPWIVDRVFRHLLADLTGNTHRAEFCIDKLYSPDSSSGRLGLVEFRGFEMPPHPQMSLTQQLLLRALVARFWEQPYRETLVDWGTSLHDRFMLPHFVWEDFEDVIKETRRLGVPIEQEWFAPHLEFRFPKMGEFARRGVAVELRQAIEPWNVLGEEPAGGSTARYVDSSLERLQVKVRNLTDPRHLICCNGRRVPLHPTGTDGEYVAGVRYRAWQPPSCLHPTIPVDEPLCFDLLDTWMGRSLGGCRYHVGHPGGLNPETFPINAYEAESRRAARFYQGGHTPGTMSVPAEEANSEFPLTLDLRRGK